VDVLLAVLQCCFSVCLSGLCYAVLGDLPTSSLYLQRALGEIAKADIALEEGREGQGGEVHPVDSVGLDDGEISVEDELKIIGMLTQVENEKLKLLLAAADAAGEDVQAEIRQAQQNPETAPPLSASATAVLATINLLRPCLERQLQLSLSLGGDQQCSNTSATLSLLARLSFVEGVRCVVFYFM
jgi:hypothetical protein